MDSVIALCMNGSFMIINVNNLRIQVHSVTTPVAAEGNYKTHRKVLVKIYILMYLKLVKCLV